MKMGKAGYTAEEKRVADEFARSCGCDFASFVCEYKGGKAFLGDLNTVRYVGIPPAILVKDGVARELSVEDSLDLIDRS